MSLRDKLKGRRQSNNIEIISEDEGNKRVAKEEQKKKALNNPRMTNPEPIEYNEDASNLDRARGALGQRVGKTLSNHLNRRASNNDGNLDSFKKDAQFFEYIVKEK